MALQSKATELPDILGVLVKSLDYFRFRQFHAERGGEKLWVDLVPGGDGVKINEYEVAIVSAENTQQKSLTLLMVVLIAMLMVFVGLFALVWEKPPPQPTYAGVNLATSARLLESGTADAGISGKQLDTQTSPVRLKKDVEELMRLFGYSVEVKVLSAVDVEVKGYFRDVQAVVAAFNTQSLRAVIGARRVHLQNLMVSPSQELATESYIEVQAGNDPYIVDSLGSRYYRGSMLPDGRRFNGVEKGHVLLEENGVLSRVKQEDFIISNSKAELQAFSVNHQRGYSGYDLHILKAAKRYEISPALIKAIVHAESGFNPRARSHAGAMGLMQIMPATARELGLRKPFNVEQNILKGSQYLKQLLIRYPNSLDHALAAYNAGMGAVAKYGGVPPYQETIGYVRKVKRLARLYQIQFPATSG